MILVAMMASYRDGSQRGLRIVILNLKRAKPRSRQQHDLKGPEGEEQVKEEPPSSHLMRQNRFLQHLNPT